MDDKQTPNTNFPPQKPHSAPQAPMSEPMTAGPAPGDVETPTVGSPAMPTPTPAQGDLLRSPNSLAMSQSTDRKIAEQNAMTMPAPKKNRAKKGLVAIIIAAALVALGGGAALGWTLWYQNPDKVVTDGLLNVLRAQSAVITGDMVFEDDNMKATVALDGKGMSTAGRGSADVTINMKSGELKGAPINFTGAMVYSQEGDLYVKADNIAKTFDQLVNMMIQSQAQAYADFGYTLSDEDIAEAKKQARSSAGEALAKIDGQWIKFSAKDMKSESDDKAVQTCVQEAVAKLQNDKAASKQLLTMYKENRFIEVKEELGSIDGSLGYVVDVNRDAAKSFGAAVEQTDVYKEMKACAGDDEVVSDDMLKGEDDDTSGMYDVTRFELWIDQLSHKVTHVSFSGEHSDARKENGKTELKLDTQFDGDVTVDVPTDAKSFDELKAELQGLQSMVGLV